MIVNPRPTRAELTDVANAIFDGTDAIMLSGETAVGAYPIEAVKTMDKIAVSVEQSVDFRNRMQTFRSECFSEVHNPQENMGIIMSRSGVEIAIAVNAKALVTPTLSGNTARLLSVFRPDEPVLAVTSNEHAERIMSLYWGVHACRAPLVAETEGMIQNAMKVAMDSKVAGISDKIVFVAGMPLHSPNMVNTVRVIILGTVIARSRAGGHSDPEMFRVRGKIIQATTPKEARDKLILLGGEILVCKILTKDFIPILRIVKGVISEEVSEITDADLRDVNPSLVWLTQVSHASGNLESGFTVTLDASQLLIYEGSI
jgi:pyruvate kinase